MKTVLVKKLIVAFLLCETFSKVEYEWKYKSPSIDKINALADRLLDGKKPQLEDLDIHEKTNLEDQKTAFEKLFDIFKATLEISLRGIEFEAPIPVVEDVPVADAGSDLEIDNVGTDAPVDVPVDAPDINDENFNTAGAEDFKPADEIAQAPPAETDSKTGSKKPTKKS